ncbi:hypothetical protein [Micromonospora sp. NBC_01813]|uniref:hypothetical protein n=1 Tax=Micromonospora sp. NBC_01813 TaxID=2975988 RepID=UPI002DDC2C5C|nr:hypothetical protein [Micromonospora sp. NBC_01813]WSA12176.1 hypothetical protein OG958_16155 [Micromonospora sp. NBC_01813]
MDAITAAVALGQSGQRAQARDALTALWGRIGDDGDAFHRCVLAHYLADLQDTVEAELHWDERALAAAADLSDERAQQHDSSFKARGFLPSLHLNLADVHRRLGNTGLARKQLAAAGESVHQLPDDAYGEMIRSGIDSVSQALDAGSTERLAAHP